MIHLRSQQPRIFAIVLALAATSMALAQTASSGAPAANVVVRVGRLLDVRSGQYLTNVAISVAGERIRAVGPADDIVKAAPVGAQVIDLGAATVLPGLIDCHTHLMARIPDERYGYEINLLTKSQAYRALEGAANARATLEAGFTSVRDVENEGSGYADVALRNAIREGLVAGPRMQVATRGIAAVGQYFPFRTSPDLAAFPTGAEMVSGVEEARRAVREQLGRGADLIKIYAPTGASRRSRSPRWKSSCRRPIAQSARSPPTRRRPRASATPFWPASTRSSTGTAQTGARSS